VIADAVLRLVAAADLSDGGGGAAGGRDWLAGLALTDTDGSWTPAGELVLPGSGLAAILAPGALGVLDAGWVDRWGAGVMVAVGVLATFALVREDDVAADPDGTDHDLDGEGDWLEEILAELPEHAGPGGAGGLPPTMPQYLAVRDLDLVADDQWPAALALLAADPALRAAVVEPQRVVDSAGRLTEVPSYTAWWLRSHPVLAGRRPGELRAPGTGTALAAVLDEAPDLGLDATFLRALGVVTSVDELVGSPMLLPLLRAGVRLDGPPGELLPGAGGTRLDVPAVVALVLPEAAATYVEHGELAVAGVECDWWVDDDGTVYAATTDGLARGLAWAADRWDLRLLLAAVLAVAGEPERVEELLAEDVWS
jgi:hypothetical protein